MKVYYDTSVLIKLYTFEPESAIIQQLVVESRIPIGVNSFHLSECASALMLKAYRGECEGFEAKKAMRDIEEDLFRSVLRRQSIDWELAWEEARKFSLAYASLVGVRTLDVLHVACAQQVHARKFITGDQRQAALAREVGLEVLIPYGSS